MRLVLNMFTPPKFALFVTLVGVALCHFDSKSDGDILTNEVNDTKSTADNIKQALLKICSNSSYPTCAKYVLAHLLDRLDSVQNVTLIQGISLRRDNASQGRQSSEAETSALGVSEAAGEIDKYLLAKIRKYFSSLTLNVKLLDKSTVENMRSFGDVFRSHHDAETGRRRKHNMMNSLMMTGWLSGATLLALTLKTIAILSVKALMAALLSLLLSVISAFSGKSHGHTKSTTYEIITKPVVAHTHAAETELHPAASYAYSRAINLDDLGPALGASSTHLPSDIDKLIYKMRADGDRYALPRYYD